MTVCKWTVVSKGLMHSFVWFPLWNILKQLIWKKNIRRLIGEIMEFYLFIFKIHGVFCVEKFRFHIKSVNRCTKFVHFEARSFIHILYIYHIIMTMWMQQLDPNNLRVKHGIIFIISEYCIALPKSFSYLFVSSRESSIYCWYQIKQSISDDS